jgi:hypothetical protein
MLLSAAGTGARTACASSRVSLQVASDRRLTSGVLVVLLLRGVGEGVGGHRPRPGAPSLIAGRVGLGSRAVNDCRGKP